MILGPNSNHPVASSDPLYMEKMWAWKILQDAVCKSCLTNDFISNKVKSGIEAIKYLAETRDWIMAMGTNMVGDALPCDMKAGFECGFCVDLLGFDIKTFQKFMRGLWDERDEKILDRLTMVANKERSKRNASLKLKRGYKPPKGPVASLKNIKSIERARESVYRSRKWGRDGSRV